MSILDEIFAHKRLEVAAAKQRVSEAEIRRQAEATPVPPDFIRALTESARPAPRLIAEVKHRSPSKGILCQDFDPLRLAQIYAENGAAAISVLTDEKYFGGRLEYLREIAELFRGDDFRDRQELKPAAPRRINPVEADRSPGSDDFSRSGITAEVVTTAQNPRSSAFIRIPLLRKDFIFDPYQLLETRAAGASAVLLIVAMLEQNNPSTSLRTSLQSLISFSNALSLTPLVEVHTRAELGRALEAGAKVIGINNRDLHTFKVSLQTTLDLRPLIPAGIVVVAESGIKTMEDVTRLADAGVEAMLIGEGLVSVGNIAKKVQAFSGGVIG